MAEKLDKRFALLGVVLAVLVIVFLVIPSIPKSEVPDIHGRYYAEMSVRDYGIIRLELDADTAPLTVQNFIDLVKEGFYDGLTFHRVIDGFMIQGGDPYGVGSGGSGTCIKGEFSANGVENNLSHTRGVISMARKETSFDSASSQFFIVQQDSTFLDGNYASFGWVTEGMEVVDAICRDAEPYDENGSLGAGAQPVIEYIRMLDGEDGR